MSQHTVGGPGPQDGPVPPQQYPSSQQSPSGQPYPPYQQGQPYPSWGAPVPPGAWSPSAPPLSASGERDWATGAHLSAFVASIVALGFLGPLIVRLSGGQRSAFVHRHATEALNFNLSVLLWAAVCVPLILVLLIGIPMLIGLGVTWVVATVMGAMAAQRGEDFRYPITIRFFR